MAITIPREQKKSYPILFGSALPLLISRLPSPSVPHHQNRTKGEIRSATASAINAIAVITDHTVRRLYGTTIARGMRAAGYRAHLFSFPAGEHSKTATTKQCLDEALLKKNCGRDTVIIALGGGVVGDVAGFIASTYMRGIPYIHVPTTLLAMVDSSIGGKTGIDTPYGKNMIGSFWQPSAVIIDTAFLKTLPKRHIQNGMLEAIKMHLVIGTELSGFQDPAHIRRSIRSSLSAKARIVQRDEKEHGERMLLNFGHTIGHAIEKVSGYTVLHGIAVGYGILAEARIAHEIGLLSSDALERITLLLRSAGIAPATLRRWNARAIIAATKHDKKRHGGKPLYVLLRDIGSPYRKGAAWAHPVPDSVVYRSLTYILTSKV